ncbi:adenosylcobinamide-GDP ribazoletransferase [Streptomyces sp. SID13031]|uniref:adenosylcobinamide-GDP ribazoletransferase n=1 Tax=Streptomyces sp. SID13031 TaxID=2706046 RepID=UPI0013CD89AD|nr:adenosylcobinamide-GDP ribazoletransferase [Streptomyces sp. SID13031]NEA33653.1 adenosylcobinamide-GDP ribazoletransferase [Streptomyces sp. SID13031]
MVDALKLAFGTLSVLPVGAPGTVDRRVAGRAMVLAPLVGLVIGGIAAAVAYGADRLKPDAPLLSAALGVVTLMALSGGLHLDGLADTADGFGSRRDRETKLRIMKQSDIGPFGVVSITAVLLIDVAALEACIQNAFGWQALLIAGVASRLTLPWSCRTSVPSARPNGLGAMVAGTVRPYAAALVTLVTVTGAALLGWLGAPTLWGTVLGTAAAVLVAVLLAFAATRHTKKSLGGVTGDTLGATVELALPLTLLVLAFTT